MIHWWKNKSCTSMDWETCLHNVQNNLVLMGRWPNEFQQPWYTYVCVCVYYTHTHTHTHTHTICCFKPELRSSATTGIYNLPLFVLYANTEWRLMEGLIYWTDQDVTGQKEQHREVETPTAELKDKIEGDSDKQWVWLGRNGGKNVILSWGRIITLVWEHYTSPFFLSFSLPFPPYPSFSFTSKGTVQSEPLPEWWNVRGTWSLLLQLLLPRGFRWETLRGRYSLSPSKNILKGTVTKHHIIVTQMTLTFRSFGTGIKKDIYSLWLEQYKQNTIHPLTLHTHNMNKNNSTCSQ